MGGSQRPLPAARGPQFGGNIGRSACATIEKIEILWSPAPRRALETCRMKGVVVIVCAGTLEHEPPARGTPHTVHILAEQGDGGGLNNDSARLEQFTHETPWERALILCLVPPSDVLFTS